MLLTCWNFLAKGTFAAAEWLRAEGRWKIALLALTALLSVIALNGWVSAWRDRNDAQRAAQAALERVRAGDEARIAGNRAVNRAHAAKADITDKELAGNARMETVLDANQEWASQPVPPDVLDRLRD
ncbi:hypothetical protein [Sphingomonas sp.]